MKPPFMTRAGHSDHTENKGSREQIWVERNIQLNEALCRIHLLRFKSYYCDLREDELRFDKRNHLLKTHLNLATHSQPDLQLFLNKELRIPANVLLLL